MNTETNPTAEKRLSVSAVTEMFGNMAAVTKMAMRECRILVFTLFAITLVISAMTFVRSGSHALVVNELTNANKAGTFTANLAIFVAILALAYALPGIFSAIRRYLDKRVHMIMSEKFELMLLKKHSELDLARHEDPTFKDLVNKAGERGIFSMINLMEGQYDMVSSMISLVMSSVILLSIDWRLWLIVLLGEIPSLYVQLRYSRNLWDIYDTQSTTRRRFFHLRNKFHGLNSLFELQTFQNTGHFLSMIADMLFRFNAEHKSNDQKRLRADIISGLISTVAVLAVILITILTVVRGEIQIGTWLFITSTLFSFQSSFSGMFNSVARQYENSLFVSDIRKVLATKPMIEYPQAGISICWDRIPTIALDNVTFIYPGQKQPVLQKVSLKIKPGEILAIVGENGAGKTTLIKLLCRVYDPTEGAISIDGIDLRQIDLKTWYSGMALLSQSYSEYLFQIDQAIALGRSERPIDRKRVLRAAEFSGADTYIERLDLQYSQQLGREFGGIDLSKGQSQRLALARWWYRGAKFAVLDEPTAATDAKAEAAIFERLYSLKNEASIILVSHNFANVMRADRICVLDSGKIAELGSHDELMAQNGIYSRLFHLQAERFNK